MSKLHRDNIALVTWNLVFVIATLWFPPRIAFSQQSISPVETPASTDWQFQYDLFQLLLEQQGAECQETYATEPGRAEKTIVVMIGDLRSITSREWRRFNSFVANGGRLLLATDQPAIAEGFGDFKAGPVTSRQPNLKYEGFDDCIAVPIAYASPYILESVQTLVTNRSTWFVHEAGGPYLWSALATFPRGCLPPASQEQSLIDFGRTPFEGEGSVLVCADSSILSNGMLWHGDNALAAIRLSEYLTASDRKELIFKVNGQSQGSAVSRLEQMAQGLDPDAKQERPQAQWEKLLALSNAVAKEVVNSRVLNRAMQQQPRNLNPRTYFNLLAAIVTLAALIWIAWKLLTNHVVRPIYLARRRMRSAQELRGAAGMEIGDYRVAAGYLAREFCWELTGSQSPADWQAYLRSLLLRDRPHDLTAHADLTRIIDMANRGCHERITGYDFESLGHLLANLRTRYCASASVKKS